MSGRFGRAQWQAAAQRGGKAGEKEGGLAAQPEAPDERSVPVYIPLVEVAQQPATLADELQQPAARVVVVLVLLQVRGQVLDALSEERHLYFRGACIAFVLGVLPNQGLFRFLGQQTCSFDFLYLSSGRKVARGGGTGNLPTLVLLSGLPGSGKTTFAAQLAPRLDACVLESDLVRRELFPKRRYTRKESGAVFAEVRARAERALEEGRDVIVDATNLRERERQGFLELAERRGAPVVAVRLTAPDAVVRERLSGPRGGASEANIGVYNRMRGEEEPFRVPCVQVDSRYCVEASVVLTATLCQGGRRGDA